MSSGGAGAAHRAVAAVALGAACLGALVACASPTSAAAALPPLRLAPAQLGRELALEQHITVRAAGHEQQMDVLLEADAAHVKLAILTLGQVAARLDWDGQRIEEWRAPWLPAAVSGARVLDDMQLSLWPLASIRAALPAGWSVADAGRTRTLSDGAEPVALVHYSAEGGIELEQRRARYALTIVSRPAGQAAGGAALPFDPQAPR